MAELPVVYDPRVQWERIRAHRGRIIGGCISTGLTVLLLVGVLAYVVTRSDGRPGELTGMLLWVLSISATIGVAILIAQLVWLRRLRAGLADIGEGLAFIMSADGIRHADGAARWVDVASIAAAPGRAGAGYRLRVRRTDGSGFEFPLEGLDILPGSLDAAVRAYSAGRHGVDLSVVDD